VRTILDSSAILALLLEEAGAAEVEAALDGALISTVNLAEVVAALARDGNPEGEVRDIVHALALTAIAPDEAMAIDAGLLRTATGAAGLSLGDRFCLALARRLGAPVITADRAWLKVAAEVGLRIEAIR
jgi:PIN domain nuclease of toxin-antitoxin system